MDQQLGLIDDPIGRIDLTDLELDDANGGSWGTVIGIASLVFCSRNTVCGTCAFGTRGCC